MRIHLATDHAGFAYKNVVRDWLQGYGYEVVDHGANHLDPSDDYPDFIALAAAAVAENPTTEKAIVFGGSGQGEAMVANQFPNVRATVYYAVQPEILTLSREHNDANILSIGARFLSEANVIDAVKAWLEVEVEDLDVRHVRRLKKMSIVRPS